MKRYLVIALLLISADSVAIECGPTMRAELINRLSESVRTANTRLSQHGTALLNEQVRVIADTDSSAHDKIGLERGQIESVQIYSDALQVQLNTAWKLSTIRDAMVDVRDKAVVSKLLSIELSGTKQLVERAAKSTNAMLTRITRPGVAIDVAKLRDEIDGVMKTLANCTPR